MKCSVHRVATASPADCSGLERLIDGGAIDPREVIAVIGKTEGNGCVNDYTRGYAQHVLRGFFAHYLGAEQAQQILYIMSGGTEGILSPHLAVVCRSEHAAEAGRTYETALAVGAARTPPIPPAGLGRLPQVTLVADAVRQAMRDARIEHASDVHFVQIKCPLLTAAAIDDARLRGATTATTDAYESMGLSRGASALGAAVALGETDLGLLADDMICRDWSVYSARASASAGNELEHCDVLVFGNSPWAVGPYFIAHAVMRDALDTSAVHQAATAGGLSGGATFVAAFVKAEADPRGSLRGNRHTMLSDSDLNHTRHARAAVGGVVGAYFGDPAIYVSGGAEHQGPSGGGPVAVVTSRGRRQ